MGSSLSCQRCGNKFPKPNLRRTLTIGGWTYNMTDDMKGGWKARAAISTMLEIAKKLGVDPDQMGEEAAEARFQDEQMQAQFLSALEYELKGNLGNTFCITCILVENVQPRITHRWVEIASWENELDDSFQRESSVSKSIDIGWQCDAEHVQDLQASFKACWKFAPWLRADKAEASVDAQVKDNVRTIFNEKCMFNHKETMSWKATTKSGYIYQRQIEMDYGIDMMVYKEEKWEALKKPMSSLIVSQSGAAKEDLPTMSKNVHHIRW